jgi:hypothetical protein
MLMGDIFMKKAGFSIRKRYVFIIILVPILIAAYITNPTMDNYIKFSSMGHYMQSKTVKGHITVAEGKAGNAIVKIERVNFYIFSTYTPFIYVESGLTHLGAFGHFIRISDGQFDYPRWLELFD